MKNLNFIKKVLFIIFLATLTGYFISKSKDNGLRTEFNLKHQNEIESKTNRLLRIDHDFEEVEKLFEYSHEREMNSLEYSYNSGQITKQEYDKKFDEIIDKNIRQFEERIERYTTRVEALNIPRYTPPQKLENSISALKAISIVSLLGFIFIVVFDLFSL